MKENTKPNFFENYYSNSNFSITPLERKKTKISYDMNNTIQNMDSNYQTSIQSFDDKKENTKPSNETNINQQTNNQNFNINDFQKLINNNTNSNDMVNFLLKNLGGNLSSDKLKLMQEMLKMFNSPLNKKPNNQSKNNKEIDTSSFVKTSDYILD